MLELIMSLVIKKFFIASMFIGSTQLSSHSITLLSGFLAIISVNVVIAFYICMAMKEPSDKHEPDPAFLANAKASLRQNRPNEDEDSSQTRKKKSRTFTNQEKKCRIEDCGLSAASSLVSCLPPTVRGEMALKLGEKTKRSESLFHCCVASQVTREVVISLRKEAAECMRKIARHRVMVSSARQAASGLLMAGAVCGVRFLSNKMHKAWKSWI
ncbi:unnamed protein product [Camellia sinensis]